MLPGVSVQNKCQEHGLYPEGILLLWLRAETLPKAKDGDVFVMRLILHDWDDKDCVTILSNVRAAMEAAKARLLIVEVCISARSPEGFSCD